MQVEDIRNTAVAALEEIKARDIEVMDVRKLTSLFDYMIVASADSARQTKALARNVHDRIKQAGGSVVGIEGEQAGEWVLVDLGAVVVHIMQPAVRDYYNLEQLWGGKGPRSVVHPRRASEGRAGAEPGVQAAP
jgi:ribosome-associated protein